MDQDQKVMGLSLRTHAVIKEMMQLCSKVSLVGHQTSKLELCGKKTAT